MYQPPPPAGYNNNNNNNNYYSNGEMSQPPYHGSQYQPQYQPPAPPQAYGASYNNNDGPPPHGGGGAFPGRMSSYSSNPMHDTTGRPASNYGGPPPHMDSHHQNRPSRMSHNPSVYSQQPTTAHRRNDRANTHYGHLVSEEPRRDIPCSGDACGACCKYNSLACLFCCNGWMRLCGGGMSIKEILKLKMNRSLATKAAHLCSHPWLARAYTSSKETARDYLEKAAAAPFEVFDRNAKRMQRNRAAARATDSREVDYLKDEVAARVSDRLLDIKRRYHTVVEIGAGCGHLAKAVDDDMMDRLIMCDMAKTALDRDAGAQYDVQVERRIVDEETPVFEPESLDAVVSSLSMHWVNDLPGMLIQIRKALVPDGVFIGAMFGGDSLFELRTSLQLADIERDGGIAARVSPLTDTRDVGSLLNRAGLTLSTIDVDSIVVNYPSMLHLVSDINAMGEGNAVVQRLPFIKRDTLLAASAIYKELYGNEDSSIPATFQVIYMIGWKPDPSQPKPLARGSGQVSLGEMFNADSHKL